jgi:ubiquinone/menaquinone biosynthesis C-methylase UbiE
MNELELRDSCRANLNKFTKEGFSKIPKIDKPKILDLGCGTGVPAILLAEISKGTITAIDKDKKSLDWFKEKIELLGYTDRINIIHDSILNVELKENHFDIILAEGILHIIGLEKGLVHFRKFLNENGYFMIHDELKNEDKKLEIFDKHGK